MTIEIESKETIAQRAHRLLKDIPKEDWISYIYTDEKKKCCAVGHYMRLLSSDPLDFSSRNCNDKDWRLGVSDIRLASEKFFRKKSIASFDISSVNNCESILYPQDNSKDRVMALLEDMIKAGF